MRKTARRKRRKDEHRLKWYAIKTLSFCSSRRDLITNSWVSCALACVHLKVASEILMRTVTIKSNFCHAYQKFVASCNCHLHFRHFGFLWIKFTSHPFSIVHSNGNIVCECGASACKPNEYKFSVGKYALESETLWQSQSKCLHFQDVKCVTPRNSLLHSLQQLTHCSRSPLKATLVNMYAFVIFEWGYENCPKSKKGKERSRETHNKLKHGWNACYKFRIKSLAFVNSLACSRSERTNVQQSLSQVIF